MTLTTIDIGGGMAWVGEEGEFLCSHPGVLAKHRLPGIIRRMSASEIDEWLDGVREVVWPHIESEAKDG